MPKTKNRSGKSSKSKKNTDALISNAKRKARKTPGLISKKPNVPFIRKPKKPGLGKPIGSPQTITGNAVTLVSKYVATAQEVTIKITGINSGVTKEVKVTVNPK
jgi:hypothetical protein